MKKAILALAACSLVLGLLACSGLGFQGDSSGSLTIAVSERLGKTLAPSLSMTPASYRITGTHEGNLSFSRAFISPTTSVTVDSLVFGTWAITVNAYNAGSTLIGSGTASATVGTNKTTAVTISVEPLLGDGSLDLSIDWAGSLVENVSMTASLISLAGTELSLDSAINSFSKSALPAGYYTLRLQLSDTGTVLAGAVETVRIVAGQHTSGTISFVNLQSPGGSLAASIVVSMKNPITLSLSRDVATSDTADMVNLVATPMGASGPVSYTWFVNALGLPPGSIASNNRLSLPPSQLAVGDNRVDVIASLADGTQAGGGTFILPWAGTSASPPASPQANWVYYDSVMGLPYIYDGLTWRKFSTNLQTVRPSAGSPAGDYSTIQTAIDAVPAGSIVKLAAGTYDGTIDITKQLALIGAGSGFAGTILINTGGNGEFAKLPGVVGATYGIYRPTVIISSSGSSGSPLLLRDLMVGPRPNNGYPLPGILLRSGPNTNQNPATAPAHSAPSFSYISLVNIHMIGHTMGATATNNNSSYPADAAGSLSPLVSPTSANEWGFAVDGRTSLDHLVVDNCQFSEMIYGMVIFKTDLSSTVSNVSISRSIFSGNSVKGFYAEKLSSATFTDVAVTDNGSIAHAPYYWSATNAGIDLNLKSGNYANLSFANLTVTGNGLGSFAGAGLTIKARGSGDDLSYATNPATLSGLSIVGGSYTGNTVGIRIGEIKATAPFTSLNLVSPMNVTTSGSPAISGNIVAGILNATDGALNLPNQVTSYPAP